MKRKKNKLYFAFLYFQNMSYEIQKKAIAKGKRKKYLERRNNLKYNKMEEKHLNKSK